MRRVSTEIITSAKEVMFFGLLVCLSAGLLEELWMNFHEILGRLVGLGTGDIRLHSGADPCISGSRNSFLLSLPAAPAKADVVSACVSTNQKVALQTCLVIWGPPFIFLHFSLCVL